MDDPWGSPWAADPTPPKIELPAAPPLAHIGSETQNHSPKRGGTSPWGGNDDNEDDAWGGWNDAQSARATPAWGRSPGLRPLSGRVTREPSPDPWGTIVTAETSRKRDDEVLDSAISLGDDLRRDGLDRSKPLTDLDAHAVWTTKDDTYALEPADSDTSDGPERPVSPDSPVGSPSKALGADIRPETVRQSSKVQELVELYDGIAKQGTPPVEIPTLQTKSEATSEDEEPVAEANSTDDSDMTDTDSDHEQSIPRSPALDNDSGFSSEPIQSREEDETSETVVLEEEELDHPTTHSPQPPQGSYPIDVAKLVNDLFPDTPASITDPELVPDVIIDDTFASISERKAWYRLSRFGSMRKHNLGDDEGYVRVTWAGSEVRDRTIRIVRRWMEEDSIAGRVVLGRRTGAIGASMFGWDSDAPQVDVGELLGRKGKHSRRVSQASKGTTVSPTVAAFGWSSSLPSSPTVPIASTPRSPVTKANGHAISHLDSPAGPGSRLSIQPPAKPLSLNQALAAPPAPVVVPTISATVMEEGDDDDWGEMVSSPTVATSAAIAPTTSLEPSASGGVRTDNAQPAVLPDGKQDSPTGVPSQADHHFDPWASADLDFFDKDSKSLPATSQPSSFHLTEKASAPDTPYATTSTTLPTNTSSIPISTTKATPLEHNDAHEEEIVAGILRDLPDLGYMLR